MRKDASHPSGGKAAVVEGLQLVLETTSWVAGWLVLPVWLGVAGADAADFILYAVGAGILLSLGVALDRSDGFRHLGDAAWFGLASILALLLVGGLLFGIARAVFTW